MPMLFYQYEKVDYSITQTTLDDVFVRFARLQRENFDDVAGEGLSLFENWKISSVDFMKSFLADPDFDASSHSGTMKGSVATDDSLFTEL